MENPLDQFYTKAEIAKACWQHFVNTLSALNRSPSDLFFVEPAAGTGAFYKRLPAEKRFGIDLVPKCDDVKRQDFFKSEKFYCLSTIKEYLWLVAYSPF